MEPPSRLETTSAVHPKIECRCKRNYQARGCEQHVLAALVTTGITIDELQPGTIISSNKPSHQQQQEMREGKEAEVKVHLHD